MSLGKYLNKNKIGGLILIIVIIIAFGFGGFGGGFLSNNQNNIVKINKTNITTQDFIDYVNQSGISQKTIKDNLNNDIIEELLSGLVSIVLLDLEAKDFNMRISQNSLSKKIRLNKNFLDENGTFQRLKYEKFLLENNISAPLFEKRLKDREMQKKLFNFIGAGTISPQFYVTKLFEVQNRKLDIDFINLKNFYIKENEITEQDLISFINENSEQLKIEYIDFKYAVINPQILIGVNEFNQEFFNKIDQIENKILNGINFNEIITEFNLKSKSVKNYKFLETSNDIEKKIYEVRKNNFDIFENKENFVVYKIDNLIEKNPNLKDSQIKKEILKLILQQKKFEYNKKLLDEINGNKFAENDFLSYGKDKIESLTLNSIKDNKIFDINSVRILYSLPLNSFTLINDEENNIYLAKIVNYNDMDLILNSKDYDQYFDKENTRIRNAILKSYDLFLYQKYNVTINPAAINNVKNLFQ